MKLNAEQLARFDELGYVFIPECFSQKEVEALRQAASDVLNQQREEVWREKDGTPRTAFACHTYNEACELLVHDARLIEPLEQLFGERTYVHQFKINAKAAFTGDVWQWHQDFPTWHKDDGMPEPKAMNIAIFLDEVMPINGPLMIVPRSHRVGELESAHDLKTTSYPLWTPDNETVSRLVEKDGIIAPTGKAGGVLMFHANILHGSAGNITPYPRRIVYLTLSAVSNALTNPTRPDFIAHRDFTPVEKGASDALARYADEHLVSA
ncbi:phytanoyl-CoA dioxygenase family protein [Acidovorax sp. JHL-9]|uniref:phytanoyl-CoA dioxygenase family protein n=1 Tax=Acidovorax sp. JHL-9 TaxID=1276756 RepID=UPI000427B209|nr:phytanoyl-CoA dioxygenase family protein [Acidovorax sp. JHL-9]